MWGVQGGGGGGVRGVGGVGGVRARGWGGLDQMLDEGCGRAGWRVY